MDKDDSGSIDRREITRLVKKLVAPDATKEDVKAIANALDTDKGGSITFREFQIFVSPIVETIKVRLRSLDAAKLRRAFFQFDKDDSGSINVEELSSLVKFIVAPDASDGDIEILVEAIDSDASGEVSFEEFIEFIGLSKEAEERAILDRIKVSLSKFSKERLGRLFQTSTKMVRAR